MTLATCPSPAAGVLRGEITDRIAAGESEAQIADSLVYRFGNTLCASPGRRGAGLALWVVPALLSVAMLLALFLAARPGRRSHSPGSEPPSGTDAKLASQLDDELRNLE